MTIAIQEGQFVAIGLVRKSPRQAVRELLESLPDQDIRYLTFDLNVHRWDATELATWISEFEGLYNEMVIQKELAALLPPIVVFADHFTDEQETPLRQVGAVLYDRSLPCNQNCKTTEELITWLDQNRQISMAADAQQVTDLPQPPASGISSEDLIALNSHPPGTSEEELRQILKTFNSR